MCCSLQPQRPEVGSKRPFSAPIPLCTLDRNSTLDKNKVFSRFEDIECRCSCRFEFAVCPSGVRRYIKARGECSDLYGSSLPSASVRTRSLLVGVIPFLAILAIAVGWPKMWVRVFSPDYFRTCTAIWGRRRLSGLTWCPIRLSASLNLVISGTLTYLVGRSRQDILFHWIVLAFGVFIVACGATHVMEVITIWVPVYVLSAVVKAITAIASVATAIVLLLRMRDILALVRTTGDAAETTMRLRRSESRLRAITRTAADASSIYVGIHRCFGGESRGARP